MNEFILHDKCNAVMESVKTAQQLNIASRYVYIAARYSDKNKMVHSSWSIRLLKFGSITVYNYYLLTKGVS